MDHFVRLIFNPIGKAIGLKIITGLERDGVRGREEPFLACKIYKHPISNTQFPISIKI
jgi:hypothetical protein